MKTRAAKSIFTNIALSIAMLAGTASFATAQSSQDGAGDRYAALLDQIADMKSSIALKRVVIENQQAEIKSLREQIANVQGTKQAIGPMLDKINAAVSSEIRADLPFNEAERNNRLAGFDEILAEREALPGDKWRRAMNLLSAEVAYGQSVESYKGNHPIAEKAGARLKSCESNHLSSACALTEKDIERIDDEGLTIADLADENNGLGLADGDYLRYGRLALAYVQADRSEVYRYDPSEKSWTEMKGARALEIRRSVKMAKGEAAPNVMTAPIWISE